MIQETAHATPVAGKRTPHSRGGDPITFSFGENWKDFLGSVRPESIEAAQRDIVDWLGGAGFAGRSVLDIGCGSGIHSFCFYQGGAQQLLSFDVDRHSVEATQSFWRRAGQPANWTVMHGSVLDDGFTANLGRFDVVYSWGVLHHTGAMWEAVGRACKLVAPGGRLWISLYTKGPTYPVHLALKQRYNRASWLGKKWMAWTEILRIMRRRMKQGQNPFTWNERRIRGMNVYHDLIDWLGGLPYEVADADEVIQFCAPRGLKPDRVFRAGEGGCSIYLFAKDA